MRPPPTSARSGSISVLLEELEHEVGAGFRKGETSLVNRSDILLLNSSEPPARCADEHSVPLCNDFWLGLSLFLGTLTRYARSALVLYSNIRYIRYKIGQRRRRCSRLLRLKIVKVRALGDCVPIPMYKYLTFRADPHQVMA